MENVFGGGETEGVDKEDGSKAHEKGLQEELLGESVEMIPLGNNMGDESLVGTERVHTDSKGTTAYEEGLQGDLGESVEMIPLGNMGDESLVGTEGVDKERSTDHEKGLQEELLGESVDMIPLGNMGDKSLVGTEGVHTDTKGTTAYEEGLQGDLGESVEMIPLGNMEDESLVGTEGVDKEGSKAHEKGLQEELLGESVDMIPLGNNMGDESLVGTEVVGTDTEGTTAYEEGVEGDLREIFPELFRLGMGNESFVETEVVGDGTVENQGPENWKMAITEKMEITEKIEITAERPTTVNHPIGKPKF